MTNFGEDIKQEAESTFVKRFTYSTLDAESLASTGSSDVFTSPPWQDAELQALKERLNETKSLLSSKDIAEWHQHTSVTNQAGYVIPYVKRHIRPELCTQAWCKFYEIQTNFPLIPCDGDEFNSVHLCEAPGAFITSLNHYIKSMGSCKKWNWLANTLNPYYEGNDHARMIDDDRFIFDTVKNWYFGDDNTGDIMAADNVVRLKEVCRRLGSVHLVTADGSIDCANNPAEQEQLVTQLHYCELIAGLQILSPGGTLVIKMFTLLEDTSVCFMYLLCQLFDQVNVFKPATSKAGNSEVYVIAANYRADQPLEQFTRFLGSNKPQTVMFSRNNISESFMQQHHQCCHFFVEQQIETIMRNLRWFESMTVEERSRMERVKQCCAWMYLERCHLVTIDNNQRVVPDFQVVQRDRHKSTTHLYHSRKRHKGSFVERQVNIQLPWQQRVWQMQGYDVCDVEVTWMQGQCFVDETDVEEWTMVVGRPISCISSSKFCDRQLLQQYNDILTNAQCRNQSTTVTENCYRDGIVSVMTHLTHLVSTDSGDAVQNWTFINLGQSNGAFLSHVQQHFPDNLKILSEDTNAAACGEDKDTEEGRRRIWCLEGDNTDRNWEDRIEWGNRTALRHLTTVLKELRPGHDLVMQTAIPLTRVTAGVMFILYSLFKQMTIFGSDDGSSELVYIVASKCHDTPPAFLIALLEKVQQKVEEVAQLPSPERKMLLEFIPIQALCEANFYTYVCSTTNLIVKKRINFLIEREKLSLEQKQD